jgi:hypothetical protein
MNFSSEAETVHYRTAGSIDKFGWIASLSELCHQSQSVMQKSIRPPVIDYGRVSRAMDRSLKKLALLSAIWLARMASLKPHKRNSLEEEDHVWH